MSYHRCVAAGGAPQTVVMLDEALERHSDKAERPMTVAVGAMSPKYSEVQGSCNQAITDHLYAIYVALPRPYLGCSKYAYGPPSRPGPMGFKTLRQGRGNFS